MAPSHLPLRALNRLEAGRDASAREWFDRARCELRRGQSDASHLRRAAETVTERSRAGRAYWAVGDQADENIEVLLAMIEEADGRFRERMAWTTRRWEASPRRCSR